jgi:hypothetical protein
MSIRLSEASRLVPVSPVSSLRTKVASGVHNPIDIGIT